MNTLQVSLGDRSYPIFIASDLLHADTLTPWVRARQVMIVTNETLAPLYLERVQNAFSGLQTDTVILPDGEHFKTLGVLERIFDALLDKRHSRTTTLVALGGGVVGDMTGFAAACYQRGVDFIQIPTTLLAQVDSSVGGKTAVNHPRGKNMIGAFYQPKAVVIDTNVLSTLPDREFSAGVAEIIKYGLIRDMPFFDWLDSNMERLMAREPDIVAEAIYRSCQNKAEVVAEDETEQGSRALLNLGHTFGHAIETATGYRDWLHGEAVGAGMYMAAGMSQRLGWLAAEELERIRQLTVRANLPVEPPAGLTPETCLDLMGHDKKVLDGALRLVLLKRIGQAVVTAEYPRATLLDTLTAFCRD